MPVLLQTEDVAIFVLLLELTVEAVDALMVFPRGIVVSEI